MALDFLQDYFCAPILQNQGYNLVNTLVFAAIALLVAFLVIYPFFNKRKVKFDFKFGLAVLGFIILGSSARLIDDLNLTTRSCNLLELNFYLITPGIYIAVGIFAILALAFSLWFGKKFKKDKIKVFGIIGYLAALPFLAFAFLNFKEWPGFAMVLFFALLFTGIVWLAFRLFGKKLLQDRLNMLAFFGQVLDGSATFTALQFFNCGEQHVVSGIITSISPLLFPLVKILVMLLILYYVDSEIKNENLRGFVKVLILILGFAPGIRDALTIGVGTCGLG